MKDHKYTISFMLRRGWPWLLRRLERGVGIALGSLLTPTASQALASRLFDRDPRPLIDVLGVRLNRKPNLDNIPLDLPVDRCWQFEHLAGLFASTSLDHGVISMTIRQSAYLFGLIRTIGASKVIEIGRYKGGSTLLIAAAMNGRGQFWSIDIGEKESRLFAAQVVRPFDQQISDICQRFGLKAELIVGDSRTVDIDTGDVDLVFIDGDHSYEGVKSDFERYGKVVRVGGALLFDDAFGEAVFKTDSHAETVGRLVNEIIAGEEFRLVKKVNRMAHLERIAGPI